MSDLPIMPFETEADWEQWLEENHMSSDGVWVKIAKKASAHVTIDHQ
jgi:uncharacterized protein YdeI (YjbR/CyaY-like superfamily)